jgi:drug/metabolite transporter (DMT)-like permease
MRYAQREKAEWPAVNTKEFAKEDMDKRKVRAIFYAVLAAIFYAINVPASKVLLQEVGPTTMAALLYLGAGVGIGILFLFNKKDREKSEPLSKSDLPFVIGMIVLDIAAPIFLMLGLNSAASANVSLLNNFEIVATSLIALLIFRENISRTLWISLGFITAASVLLSFDGAESLQFSGGSLFVLAACLCWGLENNCTRALSSKSAVQIVVIKGIFSGLGALIVAMLSGGTLPGLPYFVPALLLGFVSYGLSIYFYVRAQKYIGAASTSAYYSVSPFIGALLSFLIFDEALSKTYPAALIVMLIGAAFAVMDTLQVRPLSIIKKIFGDKTV